MLPITLLLPIVYVIEYLILLDPLSINLSAGMSSLSLFSLRFTNPVSSFKFCQDLWFLVDYNNVL